MSILLDLQEKKKMFWILACTTVKHQKSIYISLFFRLDSDLAKRNSFAHFSAFRPVAKIGDILQLSSSSTTSASGAAAAASIQDSGEICEVSTTVDKDEESDSSPSKLLTKFK